jgi:hypothetical protein
MKYLLSCLCLILLSLISTRADGSTPVYQVSGTLTVAGLPSCGASCNETINFDFQLTYDAENCGGDCSQWDAVILSGTASGSGLIGGAWTLGGIGSPQAVTSEPPDSKSDANYIALEDAAGDEFDIYLNGNRYYSAVPPPPMIEGGYLYGCNSATCFNDLDPLKADKGIYDIGTLTSSTSVVPEPPQFTLIALGLGFVALLRRLS